MLDETKVRKTIKNIFFSVKDLKDISESDDIFDHGVSSLTVVDLQLRVEQDFGLSAPTHELMKQPSIDGWTSIYLSKVK